jgi:surface antigen
VLSNGTGNPSVKTAITGITIVIGFAFTAPPAVADPPPWAPAHGYRAKKGHGNYKKDKSHNQRAEVVYVLPPGLRGGTCNARLFEGQVIGGLIGAAAGGYVGSTIGKGKGKLAATAIGTLVGAVIGQSVGEQLARAEDICFSQTFEHVPDREMITWNDAERDTRYEVVPRNTVKTAAGEYCREHTARATVGGKPVETNGTACRQPDGSWKLIN